MIIKYPLSNSNKGFFETTKTTRQDIKQLLLNLFLTQEGQLVYDVYYGLNIQQFLFNNISLDQLHTKVKEHIIYKVKRYIKQVDNIQLYINTEYTNINKHIVYFKLTYTINTVQNDEIEFRVDQQGVEIRDSE